MGESLNIDEVVAGDEELVLLWVMGVVILWVVLLFILVGTKFLTLMVAVVVVASVRLPVEEFVVFGPETAPPPPEPLPVMDEV